VGGWEEVGGLVEGRKGGGSKEGREVEDRHTFCFDKMMKTCQWRWPVE